MAYKQLNGDLQSQIDKLFDEIVTLENRLEEAETKIKRLEAAVNNQKIKEEIPKRTGYSKLMEDPTPTKVPPERRSELAMSKERIRRATELFEKNFNVDGAPTTNIGIELAKKYGWIAG